MGKIGSHLLNVASKGRLRKPSLSVHATMDSTGPGMEVDGKYRREEVKRLLADVSAMEDKLANWDHEEVGKQAQKSLRTELAIKKARLDEARARLGENDDQDEGE